METSPKHCPFSACNDLCRVSAIILIQFFVKVKRKPTMLSDLLSHLRSWELQSGSR